MNDKYVINRLSDYQLNPKYNFLGMTEAHVASTKPIVTARLHNLPVVPLSKPLVVSTGISPTSVESSDDQKKTSSNFVTHKKEDGFTMSQSWPVTVDPIRSSLQGKKFLRFQNIGGRRKIYQ